MKKSGCLVLIVFCLLILQNCAGTTTGPRAPSRDSYEEKRMQDQLVYEPYKVKNTIDGYTAFISQYPDNIFIDDAKRQIDDLNFAEYEKMNTLEGYREFLEKFPGSYRAKDGQRKIENIEFRNCQKKDTLEGYKAYIAAYPESFFIKEAEQWIQEFEFKRLDEEMNKKYGFDLLMYRLTLRRLKRDLALNKENDLAAFESSADLDDYAGKKYFRTHLIYEKGSLSRILVTPGNDPDVFDAVIAKALVYLNMNFKGKKPVDGFAFTLSASDSGLYRPGTTVAEYYFSKDDVSGFSKKNIGKKELLDLSKNNQ